MREFERLHPLVSFLYFLFVIGFSMFFMHPLCLGISLVCGFSYSVLLNGRLVIKTNLLYMLPMMLLTALINPLFNHRGVTIIAYLPDGNPLTAESVIFGLCASVMIVCVISWFACYNQIMTSDKFIYLFGAVIPSLSMVLSMVLRLVPRFVAQFRQVASAQRCIGRDLYSGSLIQKAKNAVAIMSIMITWSLENAIETADSMKSRGYGQKGRTAYSIYKFGKRDMFALVWIILLGAYTLTGSIIGGISFVYFPSIKWAEINLFSTSVFLAYFLLCIYPIIIEVWEVRRWKAIKLKI